MTIGRLESYIAVGSAICTVDVGQFKSIYIIITGTISGFPRSTFYFIGAFQWNSLTNVIKGTTLVT